MELTLVPPVALRQSWPLILQSLQAVMAKGRQEWIPEDVYHEIKSGEAACHLGVHEGAYVGCMVTQRVTDPYSGVQALHVWIVHNIGSADLLEAGLPMLRDMAHKSGFKRITFGSPRPGWGRRFPLLSATYEIPIEDKA